MALLRMPRGKNGHCSLDLINWALAFVFFVSLMSKHHIDSLASLRACFCSSSTSIADAYPRHHLCRLPLWERWPLQTL